MNSFFNFQFGEFNQATPNWFDWFSLLSSLFISAASIFLAFYIAERIYNREKRDKEKEAIDLQNSEIELFKNSLNELNFAIEKQIVDLQKYIDEKNFKLTFNQNVQVDFLQFIDIKYLYKIIGFENTESIKKLNSLMSSLYTIYDFRESLRDEVRTYLKKYNYHESKFYSYRQLLYTKYYSICNLRADSIIFEEGQKKWKFKDDDKFMPEYTELIIKTFENKSIIDENGLKDRKELNENFVIPLIKIAYKYVPEDYHAIEINDIANDVNSAFIDMESVTDKHFIVIDSYLANLKSINTKIKEYLN
ncbi:hypothetical protein [Flavobacterium columnare]|uniref:Phage abortive infection protein n=1 Tax=Flavobacterium columnare TaxID=996 RepID=A0AA94JNP6_9FLAO|nr:hypothetical protein [Flavobacterium columnare]MCH4828739.1 hypothetical protein [Flavobacterium columnare]MCH4831993.1 hypothetical protein [Flavobacterium columnare]